MKPALLILAAGVGSRYGGLKQLDPVGTSGETIIDYSVYDALHAGFGKVVFVIRKQIEKEFLGFFGKRFSHLIEMDYVFQELDMIPAGFTCPTERTKPWGTAHAMYVAREKIREPFSVINADDFYGRDAFKVMADFLINNSDPTHYSMVGYELSKTISEHGAVSRGICSTDQNSFLTDVTEGIGIQEHDGGIGFPGPDGSWVMLPSSTPVSMNFWGFMPGIYEYLEPGFANFLKNQSNNIKSEYYIPTLVNDLIKSGQTSVKVLNSSAVWFGVTYREDRDMTVGKIAQLVKQGTYPEKLW